MRIAIPKEKLLELVCTQVRNNFLLEESEKEMLRGGLDDALTRAEVCFSHSQNKYYKRDGEVFFNPYHSAQYGIFLYYFANNLWKKGGGMLCDKLYLLNKMLNSLDLFYEVEMPDVFFTDHPVGTVLGRAQYGRFFSFAQNCTVGNNKGIYPVIGERVRMLSYSRILGNCRIGDNVTLSSGCYVKDTDIPDNSLVFGQSPQLVIKPLPAAK